MSLMDALLLDPFALDVWVAPRTDGVLGSGTEDDPFDGSVRSTPVIAVDLITATGTTATATTHTNHGFQSNQLVQVFGVTGNDAAFYNGTFKITVTGSTTFTYTMVGTPLANASDVSCQLDPYFFDAVMRCLPIQITGMSNAIDPNTMIMTAYAGAVEHGLSNGDKVLVTGASVSNNNGTFPITVDDYSHFHYQVPGAPSGTVTGNIWCRLHQFDSAARLLPLPPLAIRLGPGVFQTKGYTPGAAASWVPRSTIKFFGSGMEVTSLQLVGAVIDNHGGAYYAISEPYDLYHDGFEASDFTIDSNMGGQPSQLVTCGGIWINGTHNRLRRLRAINSGSQTLAAESFVLGLVANQVFGLPPPYFAVEGVACWIHDCIVEQPGLNNVYTTTCLGVGSGEFGDFMVYARAAVIRNCYVNCELRQKPIQIVAITVAGGVATARTALPHGLQTTYWTVVSGVRLNGTTNNSFNGSYEISRVDDYNFTYPAGLNTPPDPLSEMWIGKSPSQLVEITSVQVVASGPPQNWKVTVQTLTPHFLLSGRTALLTNVADLSVGYGVTVLDRLTFTFYVQSPTQPSGTIVGNAFMGPLFQGGGVATGTAAVFEGNRILNCTPGTYQDTYNTKDQLHRNNYFRGVSYGNSQFLDYTKVNTTPSPISLFRLTNQPAGGSIATATTTQPHGFFNGDLVIISGASRANGGSAYNTPPDPLHNNAIVGWQVTSIVSSTSFEYDMSQYGGMTFPTADAVGAGYATGGIPPTADAHLRILAASSPLTFSPQGGSFYVATATVDQSTWPNGHGITVGEVVYISRASIGTYNGYFFVIAATKYTFEYVLPSNPNGSSTSGYYGRLWSGGKFVNENTIVDLLPTQTDWFQSCGIDLGVQSPKSADIFPQVVLRRGVIRHVDAVPDPFPSSYLSNGVIAFYCGNLIAEENVVDLDSTTPIQFFSCTNSEFFANQTSAGALQQGYTFQTTVAADELTTDIQDAALLAF